MKQLILGGARSGKSRFAENQAHGSGLTRVYLATAQALDAEMQSRIQHHQQGRDPHWLLIEEPLSLAESLQAHDQSDKIILVDCLTLWLTNCLCHEDPQQWPMQRQALIDLLPRLQASVVMVSNEVGQGVVPMDALSRRFVDEAGFLHQALAQLCDNVVLVTAGLPQNLKGQARPE